MYRVKVKEIKMLVDETGEPIPYMDNRFYDMPCENCGPMPYVGRYYGRFLCLGCMDEIELEQEEQ
jgi:hypothetical protein